MAIPDAFILTERILALKAPNGCLERGDRFDRELLGLDDQTERAIKFIRRAVPLTRESYAIQMSARPPGTIGHGFELEDLVSWGILTQAEADVVLKASLVGERYGAFWIAPVMQGRFRRLEVRDEKGKVMRAARFTTREHAVKFIDGLGADDVHIQSDTLEPAG